MAKFIIYQVLPRLFSNLNGTRAYKGTIEENGCGKFNDFTPKMLSEIKKLGVTHIWYTGVLEHATQTDYTQNGIPKDMPGVIKGRAGSPYAIKDFYDVSPDLAENVKKRITEFEQLIKRTHKAGLKAIIDFVPNHTARQYHSDVKPKGVEDLGQTDNSDWAFSPLNNYYYIPHTPLRPQFNVLDYQENPAKVTGNDLFSSTPTEFDWYETVKLNYGINYMEGNQKQFDPTPNTWHKMLDILKYWTNKGVDGFRCDMVEMVPVEFWNWVIPQIKQINPELIFIAEVYTPAKYKDYLFNGKFDYLYDKVGLYDTLRNVISKNYSASEITHAWQRLENYSDRMLNFLENHDEQRIASGFFCGDGMYAQPAMIVVATLTKAPYMIYFGQELGEKGMDMEGFSGLDGKTTIFDYWGVKTVQNWINNNKFDDTLLTEEEIELRAFYKKLIETTKTERAITEGEMYDLGYANYENAGFDPHNHFAYFRKEKKELLLCAINFNDKPQELHIKIPKEAFLHLNIKEGEYYTATNLLNIDEDLPIQRLSTEHPYIVSLPAWYGKIIKLKIKNVIL